MNLTQEQIDQMISSFTYDLITFANYDESAKDAFLGYQLTPSEAENNINYVSLNELQKFLKFKKSSSPRLMDYDSMYGEWVFSFEDVMLKLKELWSQALEQKAIIYNKEKISYYVVSESDYWRQYLVNFLNLNKDNPHLNYMFTRNRKRRSCSY